MPRVPLPTYRSRGTLWILTRFQVSFVPSPTITPCSVRAAQSMVSVEHQLLRGREGSSGSGDSAPLAEVQGMHPQEAWSHGLV